MKFERISILFNLASVHSHLAVKVNTNTDEGLKEGVKLWQAAAGYLEEIKVLYPYLDGQVTFDITERCINMVTTVLYFVFIIDKNTINM